MTRPRWLVPEVVQSSEMDCGPAVLKALLEGFGIPVGYGRLREACQTDVDGTSIDVLESVACRLGLAAEQVMVPTDHLVDAAAGALPAIVVMRLPSGFTHFVLAWRRVGPFVLVMDPAEGRRWLTRRQFRAAVYVHAMEFPAAAWRAWAGGDEFVGPLSARLVALGLGRGAVAELTGTALDDAGWRRLAALDDATRLAAALVRAGGSRRGREAERLIRALLAQSESGVESAIPERFRAVLPAAAGPDGEQRVLVRGAVLVRVRPQRSANAQPPDRAALGPELAAALGEPKGRPLQQLLRLARGGGSGAAIALALGLALTAGGTVFEGTLFRSFLSLDRDLGLVPQRLLAAAALAAVLVLLLLSELGVAHGVRWLGRRLEIRFRAAFGAKVPRLNDRYFHSRPVSDMTDRCHKIHQLRTFPALAGEAVRAGLTLVLTAGALAWLEPRVGALAAVAAGLALAVPFAFNPLLQGLDLQARTHAGALGRFYLDALLGLAALRAHGAERAVRREHEGLLVDWTRASRRFLRWAVVCEAVELALGFGFAGGLILLDSARMADAGGTLLLAFWALSVPLVGAEIARAVRQYPAHRSTTLRLLEPLGAAEPDDAPDDRAASARPPGATEPVGVAVAFESIAVRAGGHTILEDVVVRIAAGSHVAIVGPSGAGKSTLVGTLLGWHRSAAGAVRVDGEPLGPARLARLRTETVWVDPAVQLWNRSLLDNLRYGTRPEPEPALGAAIQDVGLFDALRRLPDGLQTRLGEGGGLLSGGEGQLVRLGRGWARPGARLVILDEPFRGLDRARRRRLLARARARFRAATLLCVTHDVGETADFDRVLVVERGRVVEDGTPGQLADDAGSRYRTLLDAEEFVRTALWGGPAWQRWSVEAGRVVRREGPA